MLALSRLNYLRSELELALLCLTDCIKRREYKNRKFWRAEVRRISSEIESLQGADFP